MKDLPNNVLERMIKEDPWLGSESELLLLTMEQLPNEISRKVKVEIAEIDTVNPLYKDSAALHCLLGWVYQKLPEELSKEFKLNIEKLKLAKTGNEHLLDYGSKSVAEITASLPHKWQDLGENIMAANDYAASHIIGYYLLFNNATRAYNHMKKSLELSRNKPAVFKNLVKPIALSFMTPWVLEGLDAYPDALNSGYHLKTSFVKDYRAAGRP